MPIFSGLQQRRHKVTTTDVAKPPHVTVIQSAATLLAPEKRQQHIKNIKSLLNLPPKLYQNLYHQVIEQFAEFVQSLPETAQGAFANEYGFLDHGLERASRALSLCLAYFFPQEKSFQAANSLQALWVYAVFTAALLYDIGKLAVKYQIEICQKNGASVHTWSPYTCSMVAQGKYYKYDFVKENRDNLRRLVTALLARQILSEAEQTDDSESGSLGGFNWIASNPDVLEAWLALLSGDIRSISSFLTVIPLADIQTIESHIKTNKTASLPFDLPIGDAFLQWLRDAIATHTVSINQVDSLVHVTAEGVAIDREIFDVFNRKRIEERAKAISSETGLPKTSVSATDTAVTTKTQATESRIAEQQFLEQLKVYQPEIENPIQQYQQPGNNVAKDFLLVTNPLLVIPVGGISGANIPNVSSNIVKIQAPPTPIAQPEIQPKQFAPPTPK